MWRDKIRESNKRDNNTHLEKEITNLTHSGDTREGAITDDSNKDNPFYCHGKMKRRMRGVWGVKEKERKKRERERERERERDLVLGIFILTKPVGSWMEAEKKSFRKRFFF